MPSAFALAKEFLKSWSLKSAFQDSRALSFFVIYNSQRKEMAGREYGMEEEIWGPEY